MTRWQVQEAKARFSELMEKALTEGPQVVTRHGTDQVVVISAQEYGTLQPKRRNLLEALRDDPDLDDDWLPPRDIDPEREIEWE